MSSPCTRTPPLSALAGNMSCPLLSNSFRARTVPHHPGRHTPTRGAPDHQHTPTPPHYPAGTAPVPPSPGTSPTKLAHTPPVPPAACPHHPLPSVPLPPIKGHPWPPHSTTPPPQLPPSTQVQQRSSRRRSTAVPRCGGRAAWSGAPAAPLLHLGGREELWWWCRGVWRPGMAFYGREKHGGAEYMSVHVTANVQTSVTASVTVITWVVKVCVCASL